VRILGSVSLSVRVWSMGFRVEGVGLRAYG